MIGVLFFILGIFLFVLSIYIGLWKNKFTELLCFIIFLVGIIFLFTGAFLICNTPENNKAKEAILINSNSISSTISEENKYIKKIVTLDSNQDTVTVTYIYNYKNCDSLYGI